MKRDRVAARVRVRRPTFIHKQIGATAAEYVAVLLGLIVVWKGAGAFLRFIREHHDEFSWALMIPF